MSQTVSANQEWLKVLGKGMVTLPKKWRDEMGIENGDVVKARKEGNKVIIEPQKAKLAPYRIYSVSEINAFLEEDKIPKKLVQKAQDKLSKS